MGVEAALIGGGAMLAGSLISGASNKSAAQSSADAQRAAASESSAAQIEAARIAAEASKFRPVGMSTRFGKSYFNKDAEGNITSAGYNLSPELKSLQDYAMAQARLGQTDTNRLLSLGRGYLATSPEEAAQNYYAQQRQLLNPGEETALSGIRSGLLRTGRGGLAVGQGGQMAAANPELQAYYNAIAQRDLQLAAQAEQEGRNRVTFGQGLLSSAYSPISTPLGLAATTEQLGQGAFDLGVNLGGRQTQANQAGASLLASGLSNAAQTQALGQMNAARTMQLANQTNPFGAALTGFGQQIATNPQFGNWFNNLISGNSGLSYNPGAGYGTGTAYSNMTAGEIANMQQYGI